MSNKRVMSEQGAVDPDSEPPVTRLKVPNDSSIVTPSAQNVLLLSDSRERRAPVNPSVAEPTMPDLDWRDQLEETLALNHGEEMKWENQIEGEMVGNHVENRITGNQTKSTLVDGIQQNVSNFGPEELDQFEQTPVTNVSDEEPAFIWTQTDQRAAVEAEIRESDAKPAHERGYSFNPLTGLTTGGGNPVGSTTKTFDGDTEPPTAKPVRNLMTAADNSILHNRIAPAPAVATQDGSGFVTAHPSLQQAAPENETDQSGSGNDQPQPQPSKSDLWRAAALRRKALLSRTEAALPKDILKERRFVSTLVQGLELHNEKLSFSVASYNIRAEPETESGGTRSGIGSRNANSLTGRAEVEYVPSNYNERLLIELSYLEPDILCLQSIEERYRNKLQPFLHNRGYCCWKMLRRHSGPYPDRCEAIFYRESRFDLVACSGVYLDDLIVQKSMHPDATCHLGVRQSVESREVAAFVTLRCRVTGRKVSVACMRCVPEYKNRPDLQAAQVCCVVQQLASLSANPADRMATILCGDLDFQPVAGQYQVLRDGRLSENTKHSFDRIKFVVGRDGERRPLSSVVPAVFRHPMSSLRSAYDKVFGSELPNVWKRETKTFLCSSYVWYDEGQLNLVGALDNVPSEAVAGTGIPSEFFPSGCLSLKASFQFCEDMPGTG